MTRGQVKVELSSDVALVLFEWIERQADDGWFRLSDAHSGELGALTVLAGALQSKLVEPFKAEYVEMVEAARQRLADRYGIEPPK
ncbi:MAG: hypothetical protein JWQ37_1286 [Blastococcus sp.]|nr:hypothetical protein [Blastococcus sp.]